MTLYRWSQTAASDATADPTINWAEGQAPSSVNDSARAMMAAIAKYRDDVAGAIVTAGTSTAYTVSSYEVFDSLAHLSGQVIAFTPHVTNGATVTLNVDSLGAKPLRTAPNTELLAGMLIQGTPYVAVYSNTDGAFYLQGFFGNPYNIPLGGMLDFIGSTTPNSSFVFPTGQAISRTTYANLFALVGTTYGSGDGSTTFNIIDMTGRVGAMKEASATRLTSTYFGGNSTVLGATGGAENLTLTLAQLPSGITGTVSVTTTPGGGFPNIPLSSGSVGSIQVASSATTNVAGANTSGNWTSVTSLSGSGTSTSNNTSGNAHRTVQPTIIVNKILRVL